MNTRRISILVPVASLALITAAMPGYAGIANPTPQAPPVVTGYETFPLPVVPPGGDPGLPTGSYEITVIDDGDDNVLSERLDGFIVGVEVPVGFVGAEAFTNETFWDAVTIDRADWGTFVFGDGVTNDFAVDFSSSDFQIGGAIVPGGGNSASFDDLFGVDADVAFAYGRTIFGVPFYTGITSDQFFFQLLEPGSQYVAFNFKSPAGPGFWSGGTVTLASIPLPPAVVLLAPGLVAFGLFRRRRTVV